MAKVTAPTPRYVWWKLAVIFMAGVLVGALSVVEVVPRGVLGDRTRTIADEGSAQGEDFFDGADGEGTLSTAEAGDEGAGSSLSPGKGSSGKGSSPTKGGTSSSLQCKGGKNGGATNGSGGGVSATRIKLATTVAESGIARDFLGEVRWGMEAIRRKVNREGGICGRLLTIRYQDDAWKAEDGQRYLENFMQGDYFAIPVGPSSEGLNAAIRAGKVASYSMPVVGTDGMVVSQYTEPWVWPVAVATASSARIMAIDAAAQGIDLRNVSIVFDKDYKFGREAAEAFNDEVFRRTNQSIRGYTSGGNYTCSFLPGQVKTRFCGIDAGKSSYASEIAAFDEGDYMAFFVEPRTALNWVNSTGFSTSGSKISGAQTLFTRSFANNCGSKCHLMKVWTGFKPFIESYKYDKAVQDYVADLDSVRPDSDEYNAFTEGGYVGMLLLAEALKKVCGPERCQPLTRANLSTALDSLDLTTGLSIQPTLSWRSGNHFSAGTMRRYTIKYVGTFAGWEEGPVRSDDDPKGTEARLPEHVKK